MRRSGGKKAAAAAKPETSSSSSGGDNATVIELSVSMAVANKRGIPGDFRIFNSGAHCIFVHRRGAFPGDCGCIEASEV